MQRIYRDATVVTPPDSTSAAVADLLGSTDLAHLACHGLLRSDNPMFSALLLSDGPLTLQEIAMRGGCTATVCPRLLPLRC
jgi:CHAT domain-containing protein